MSEQQQSQATTATDEQPSGPDDSEPTPKWQAELQAAYESNVAEGKAPYEGARIRTRGELNWLIRERRWSIPNPSNHANFSGAQMWGANLTGAGLFLANLSGVYLDHTNLSDATLREADLSSASMDYADLSNANLYEASISGASLRNADLSEAELHEADLSEAVLDEANLSYASLYEANLSGASLRKANLDGADLRGVRMDIETDLREAQLSTTTQLADVVWNAVPLARVNWDKLPVLGDEVRAGVRRDAEGKRKSAETLRDEYEAAVRAYRLLTVTLRSQGLNEHADRYAYRAQLLQRQVLRRQGKWGRAIVSWLLDTTAGYGYKPMRSLIAYVVIISAFAAAYLLNAQFAAPHLTWDESLVLSISSFHGRGFFTSGISLGDTLARLAAGEAIVGLLIEITFIATFTNRFFAR